MYLLPPKMLPAPVEQEERHTKVGPQIKEKGKQKIHHIGNIHTNLPYKIPPKCVSMDRITAITPVTVRVTIPIHRKMEEATLSPFTPA